MITGTKLSPTSTNTKKNEFIPIRFVVFLRIFRNYHNKLTGGNTMALTCDEPGDSDSTEPTDKDLPIIDFDDLVKQTSKRLRSFIRRRIWNADEVEDILQTSFLEALRCRDKFRGGSAPETWLFGIAMNLMRSHMRKSLQRQQYYSNTELLEEKALGKCEDPCDIVMRQTALYNVGLAYDTLSRDMRQTLVLVVEQGVSYQDAAKELGVPIGTIRSRLNRARHILKEYVEHPPASPLNVLPRYSAAALASHPLPLDPPQKPCV